MELNFMLQIIADVDEKTKEVTIKKVIPITSSQEKKSSIVHVINETEAKYGILTLGKEAKFIGMPIGTDVSVWIDGQCVRDCIRTHKSVTGRIDGMTAVYKEFLKENDKLEVSYDAEERKLMIVRVENT